MVTSGRTAPSCAGRSLVVASGRTAPSCAGACRQEVHRAALTRRAGILLRGLTARVRLGSDLRSSGRRDRDAHRRRRGHRRPGPDGTQRRGRCAETGRPGPGPELHTWGRDGPSRPSLWPQSATRALRPPAGAGRTRRRRDAGRRQEGGRRRTGGANEERNRWDIPGALSHFLIHNRKHEHGSV
ncbi:hypothetical protein BJ962_003720 [Streptomyces aureorectus]|nr:hypothetical protein [Streptomyces calvus]